MCHACVYQPCTLYARPYAARLRFDRQALPCLSDATELLLCLKSRVLSFDDMGLRPLARGAAASST